MRFKESGHSRAFDWLIYFLYFFYIFNFIFIFRFYSTLSLNWPLIKKRLYSLRLCQLSNFRQVFRLSESVTFHHEDTSSKAVDRGIKGVLGLNKWCRIKKKPSQPTTSNSFARWKQTKYFNKLNVIHSSGSNESCGKIVKYWLAVLGQLLVPHTEKTTTNHWP